MRVTVESQEAEWELRRSIILPDTAERELLEALQKLAEPTKQEADAEPPKPVAAPVIRKWPDISPEPGTYKGLLLVECGTCGDLHALNAKEPVKTNVCTKCGQTTPLEDMVTMETHCPCCDRTWYYKTNTTEAEVTVKCPACRTKMTARWDKQRRIYTDV